MRRLDIEEELLLHSARRALAAIEFDGKVQRDRVDPIWRAIAADLLNDEDAARWARRIAQNVVCDVLDDKSQDRDDRALKALGLYGANQHDYRAEKTLEVILEFERFGGIQAQLQGNVVEGVPSNVRYRNLLRAMRANGCYLGVSDANALKRLKRLLVKLAAV